MQTSNFSVFGMTCGSCVSAITTALDSHKNVESCQVSLKLNQAQVTYSCSASEIIQVIENCGFDAALLSIQEPGSPLVMNALMRTMADDDDAQTETFELMPLVSVNSAAKIQICTIKIVVY